MKKIFLVLIMSVITIFIFWACGFFKHASQVKTETALVRFKPQIITKPATQIQAGPAVTTLPSFTDIEGQLVNQSIPRLKQQLVSINDRLKIYNSKNYDQLNAKEIHDFNRLFRIKSVITKQIILRKYAGVGS